jgi:hypothetical protein
MMAAPSTFQNSFNFDEVVDDISTALQDLLLDVLDDEVSLDGSFESFHMAQDFDETPEVLCQMLILPDMPEGQVFSVPGVPGGWTGSSPMPHSQAPCQDNEAQGQPLTEIAQGSLVLSYQGSREGSVFLYPQRT